MYMSNAKQVAQDWKSKGFPYYSEDENGEMMSLINSCHLIR